MEAIERVLTEEDYIYAPRHEFSLRKYMATREDPPSHAQAAKMLLMTEPEFDALLAEAIQELRESF